MATIAVLRSSMLKPALCRFAGTVNAAVFQKYGNPTSVLRRQKMQLKDVCKNDIQLQMVVSSLTRYDMDAILGKNSQSFLFPKIGGSEGVGIVEKIGEGVTSVKEKDTVMLVKPFKGTWAEQMVVSEDDVVPVPSGVSPEVCSALLNSAGIAYRLLNDFATLKSGDFVLQNDASSTVGLAVIELCKSRGVKTINVVKDCGKKSEELYRQAELAGGDVLIRESQLQSNVVVVVGADEQDFQKILSDLPSPVLVLNGRGGSVMTRMCSQLKNSTVVTYNETTDEPFALNASMMMGSNLCFKGFNMSEWLAAANKSDVKSMVDELAGLVSADKLHVNVKKSEFSAIEKLPLTHLCPCYQTYVQTMDQ